MRGINFVISAGMAILLPILINYFVNTFHSPPEWDEYQTVDITIAEGLSGEERDALEEVVQQEKEQYLAAYIDHQRELFFVLFPAGIILVLAGTLTRTAALANGLMLGGLVLMMFGRWGQLFRDGKKPIGLP